MNTNEATSVTMNTASDAMPNTEWLRTMALATDEIAKASYNKILDLVNNEGYPLDDIRDFIEEYGYKAFVDGHYETWSGLTDNSYSMEAIEAFVGEFGIESIDGFEDSYCGTYRNGAEYARDLVEGAWNLDNIPGFVEIDWEATWENLSQDYTEVDGHIFNNHW
jgi:hypothetical protein